MLIYDALKSDHRKMKGLLNRLTQSADSPSESRTELIGEIRDELIPHSRAEEAVLYNSLRQIPEASGSVAHSYVEHMEAEALLRTLQAMDALDVNWTGVAKKLKDALDHHIAEEEGLIFDTARQVLARDEAHAMTLAFEQMKPEVREGSLLKSTLDLVANVMPPRFSESLRNFVHS